MVVQMKGHRVEMHKISITLVFPVCSCSFNWKCIVFIQYREKLRRDTARDARLGLGGEVGDEGAGGASGSGQSSAKGKTVKVYGTEFYLIYKLKST